MVIQRDEELRQREEVKRAEQDRETLERERREMDEKQAREREMRAKERARQIEQERWIWHTTRKNKRDSDADCHHFLLTALRLSFKDSAEAERGRGEGPRAAEETGNLVSSYFLDP